jgi:hypothetical protein
MESLDSITNELNSSLVTEPGGSTPLIQKPATGHDPEPVPSTSHPHKQPISLRSVLLINSLVVEPKGSTPLIQKSATVYRRI